MAGIDLSRRTAIPPDDAMNSGLAPCGNSLMNHFGKPGRMTTNCSTVTNDRLERLIVTQDVGIFRVTGLKPAVSAIGRIAKRIQERDQALAKGLHTAGMLCCRAIRGSNRSWSIHSWGAAIDLYCGADVVPLGTPEVHVGVLRAYPYFHAEGWYSGMEFKRRDSMHFEASRQLVAQWVAKGWV